MIDGWFKRHIDPLWEQAARPLVRVGFSANAVTLTGLALIAANAALFVWHRSTLVFGLGLSVAFAADALDGAVARLRRQSTRFGGYLDAMTDRYQELIVMFSLGVVSDQWAACLLGLSGGFLTSYAKARTAIEVPIGNVAWPDLFERLERIIFLCALLILDGACRALFATQWLLPAGLWIFAVVTNITAVQRMRRAGALLRRSEHLMRAEDPPLRI